MELGALANLAGPDPVQTRHQAERLLVQVRFEVPKNSSVMAPSGLLEQIPKIIKSQCPAECFFTEDVFGQVGLPDLQLTDLVLDGIADQQSVGKDCLRLTDSMGAINGLIFDGWIPPRIKKDHVRCYFQIESRAAGFQRNKEYTWTWFTPKIHDKIAAIFRLSGELEQWATQITDPLFNETQHFNKLAEHQNLVSLLD